MVNVIVSHPFLISGTIQRNVRTDGEIILIIVVYHINNDILSSNKLWWKDIPKLRSNTELLQVYVATFRSSHWLERLTMLLYSTIYCSVVKLHLRLCLSFVYLVTCYISFLGFNILRASSHPPSKFPFVAIYSLI